MRELVAGELALEYRVAVDVITGVDQPVGIQHHNRVGTHFTRTAHDLTVTVDCLLAAALKFARLL